MTIKRISLIVLNLTSMAVYQNLIKKEKLEKKPTSSQIYSLDNELNSQLKITG